MEGKFKRGFFDNDHHKLMKENNIECNKIRLKNFHKKESESIKLYYRNSMKSNEIKSAVK